MKVYKYFSLTKYNNTLEHAMYAEYTKMEYYVWACLVSVSALYTCACEFVQLNQLNIEVKSSNDTIS